MRLAFDWLAGSGAATRLTTLIFHRVLAEPDELFPDEVDARRFDAICSWLPLWFNVLPLDEAVQRLAEGRLPSRPLAISFDDGYADNHDVAMPILRRHGLTATFFVSTGFLDGGRMWNDTLIESIRRAPGPDLDLRGLADLDLGRVSLQDLSARRAAVPQVLMGLKYLPPERRAQTVQLIAERAKAPLPNDLMMRSEQVRGLHAAGMGIGAHTVNHPILTSLDDAAARAELLQSRSTLQAITGAPVDLFAYPNGKPGDDFGPRDVALVKSLGFKAAFTTAAGTAGRSTNPHVLPRFTPWRRQRTAFALQLARNMIRR